MTCVGSRVSSGSCFFSTKRFDALNRRLPGARVMLHTVMIPQQVKVTLYSGPSWCKAGIVVAFARQMFETRSVHAPSVETSLRAVMSDRNCDCGPDADAGTSAAFGVSRGIRQDLPHGRVRGACLSDGLSSAALADAGCTRLSGVWRLD